MDPRKAQRDPRLARADPRLQQPQATQPASVAPSVSYNAVPAHQWEGNITSDNASSSDATLQTQATAHFGPDTPNSQTTNETQSIPNTPSTSIYKTRPLFCVVCASNQASNCYCYNFTNAILNFPRRTGQWKDTMFCRQFKVSHTEVLVF